MALNDIKVLQEQADGSLKEILLAASTIGAAPASHTHPIAQVEQLPTTLNAKAEFASQSVPDAQAAVLFGDVYYLAVTGSKNGRNRYQSHQGISYCEYSGTHWLFHVDSGSGFPLQSIATAAMYPWGDTPVDPIWPSGMTAVRVHPAAGRPNYFPTTGSSDTAARADHTHPAPDWLSIVNKPPSFPPETHSHQILTGKTILVDAGVGTDTRTGLSKYDITRPFLTIGAAVAASTLGDLIWVRNGSYTIAAQINLGSTLFDLKGNIYFEPNTQVTIPTGVTAFSFTTNSAAASVSIDGGAIFLIAGTGGILAKGGAGTMNCTFKAVIDAAGTSAKTLFSCTGGTLFIFADAITATSATVFLVNDTQSMASRISAIVPYVLGGNCIDVSGTSTTNTLAHLTGDFWSLGGTMQPVKISGSAVPSIAVKAAIYRQDSPLGPLQNQPVIRLISSASAFGHGLILRGGPTIWDNYGNPAVGMEGAPASNYTNVAFKDVMFTTKNNAPCITANQARNVQMTSCYASNNAHANVTIEVGSLAVNARYDF